MTPADTDAELVRHYASRLAETTHELLQAYLTIERLRKRVKELEAGAPAEE